MINQNQVSTTDDTTLGDECEIARLDALPPHLRARRALRTVLVEAVSRNSSLELLT